MATLDIETWNVLARTIQDARRAAQGGARGALDALAVGSRRAHPTMTPAQIDLRVRLRSHGRQLGDVFDESTETQSTDRLAHEIAYEHWHRMLFARFLAENQLLIEPEIGQPVTIGECRELAREAGVDPWALAASFAQRMLPELFRQGDPSLQVELPRETRLALERLLSELPQNVFISDDALGWTYQFWQAERKEEVNRSGVKIGAEELPAVTQLFTEHYMVLFLLHNTIGAWRAGRILAARPELGTRHMTEDELRQLVRVNAGGGYDFEYLRFVREQKGGDADADETGRWLPAAGTFPGWPTVTKALRVMDPCCGSGHFLVEVLRMLAAMRAEEESLPMADAVKAVLQQNLFGLEIDPRCAQIAEFAAALAAWKMVARPIPLPRANISCCGAAPNMKKEDWVNLVGDDVRLRGAMARLYDTFELAPILGTLVNPTVTGSKLNEANFAEIQPHLAAILAKERREAEHVEHAAAARGMAKAAELLLQRYTLVVTNVPYLGREGHTDQLRAYADRFAPEAAPDLSTLMLQRSTELLQERGTVAAVLPQNWWVGRSYEEFRESILEETTWRIAAVLGEEAWQTFGNRGPNTILLILDAVAPEISHRFLAIDVATKPGEPVVARDTKARALGGKPGLLPARLGAIHRVNQLALLDGAQARISIAVRAEWAPLSKRVLAGEGCSTGDNDRFLRSFWEITLPSDEWVSYQRPGFSQWDFCDCSLVMRWEGGRGALSRSSQARIQNIDLWKKTAVLVGRVRGITATLSVGGAFSKGAVAISPLDSSDLPAIFSFLRSTEYENTVRTMDPRVSAATSVLTDVPFDITHWRKRALQLYPNGLPLPEVDDPTQSTFHGSPRRSTAPLQVAVARLLGYRWPAELDNTVRLGPLANALLQDHGEVSEHVSKEGVVCLDALRGQDSAADRLRRLLMAVHGGAWPAGAERDLLSATGSKAATFEEWLRRDFFELHCSLFQPSPFIWQVWDGHKDGFSALVNYHKLAGKDGRRTMDALAYTYLGEWIDRQRQQQREGLEGSDARLAAALDLQSQLSKIIDGETPYDIFVRWKPLHEQPIGWEPDISDGVRMNIRPFLTTELRSGGRRGAGILRWKPNIDWDKDRGTESQRPRELFPWYWSNSQDASDSEKTDFLGGAEFDGTRWNDMHYTKAAKRADRERHAAKGSKT